MVNLTTKISLIVQLVIGIISTRGVLFKVDPRHKILSEILLVETIVQYIELGFYAYFINVLDVLPISQMARIRYYDWLITTPTMLISTVIYFKYEQHMQNGNPEILSFLEVLEQEKNNIILICVCNFLMLLFGYLTEIKVIDPKIGITLGFIFFAAAFKIIYSYSEESETGKNIFGILLPIWGLYGVGACMGDTAKNNTYNILDIFSKNFFSLYLYYKLDSLHKH
jgi:hypothetical protein